MRLSALALLLLPAILPAQDIAIALYPIPSPGSGPFSITAGPDGALWFTEFTGDQIGRITVAGRFTQFSLRNSLPNLNSIAAGPDGALWFTELYGIGRITANDDFTSFPVTGAGSITAGPDGALWFTDGVAQIGRITTSGTTTTYTTPTPNSQPAKITLGPDGALWFTEAAANQIGRITTAGAITEYPIPTPYAGLSGITAGPDGALWFAEYPVSRIGRITTEGAVTEYPLPTTLSGPQNIASAAGALWFTEAITDRVGRITVAGEITDYPLPAGFGQIQDIARGPDGAPWFSTGGQIGEIVHVTANLTASPSDGYYHSKIVFAGRGYAPNETVQVYREGIGSGVMASAVADSTGSFTVTSRAPPSPFGARIFLGRGETSGKLGAADFSMSPRLVLTPDTGPPGTTVIVDGYGFASYENVNFDWQNPGTYFGSKQPDQEGTLSGPTQFTFTVPETSPPGIQYLIANGDGGATRAYGAFTVQ